MRKKLGELALLKKWITSEELLEILALQKQIRQKSSEGEDSLLGQLLHDQGLLSQSMLNTLLHEQIGSIQISFQAISCGGSPFQFGPYEVKRLINTGGMGSVYEAFDNRNQKKVAIKIIRSGLVRDLKKRFFREISILSKLKHPNIVRIHDYDEIDGVDFFVMDYLSGTTLDKVPLVTFSSYENWLEKFISLLDAVKSMHQENIVHRDLKPTNIMMTEENELVIFDFGLGKILESQSSITTQIIGTPAYMAPEQTFVRGEHDVRTDIWALGIIFYQMLTQKLPFADSSNHSLIHSIRHQQPRPLHFHNSDLPWQLNAICQRALQKNKDNRYSTVSAMAEDIQMFLEGKEISIPHEQEVPIAIFRYRFLYVLGFYLLSFTIIALGVQVILTWSIPGILLLEVGLALGAWIYWKQGYQICLDEKGISEIFRRRLPKQICPWEDIAEVTIHKKSLIIQTKDKTWISPSFSLLHPKNFYQIFSCYLNNATYNVYHYLDSSSQIEIYVKSIYDFIHQLIHNKLSFFKAANILGIASILIGFMGLYYRLERNFRVQDLWEGDTGKLFVGGGTLFLLSGLILWYNRKTRGLSR